MSEKYWFEWYFQRHCTHTHTCAQQNMQYLPAFRPLTGDEMVVFVDYILLSFINDTNNVCTFMSNSCAVQAMPVNSLVPFVPLSTTHWCIVNWRENSVHASKICVFLFSSSLHLRYLVQSSWWWWWYRTMVR